MAWLLAAGAASLACGGSEGPAVRSSSSPGATVDPASVERVSPQDARARVQAGQALLVCAYADALCARAQLEGAIPWSALTARLAELPQDQEIILYCA